MKKSTICLFSLLAATLVFTSCTNGGNSSASENVQSSVNSQVSSNSHVSSSSSSSAYQIPDGVKSNDDFELAKTSYVDENGQSHDLNMQTIYTNQNAPHLDPLKEQHVMVIPFGFNDDSVRQYQTQENIEKIETTFFGTPEEIDDVNGWVSVAEYYNTSSYGKSVFKGEVIPTWCEYEGSVNEFLTAGGSSLGPYAATYARNWYIAEYEKEGHGSLGEDAKPLTYFDCNADGNIDLIWIVYSHPTSSNSDENRTWWAYVTYTRNAGNVNFPTVNTLGWASVDWMNKAFNGYDPHTYIHETGHTYGLDDYYDYSNSWAPMAGIDMMDHNFGDHSAFSKFTLGWLNPWVVNDDSVIKLRPTTTTGDCFVLPSQGYNGTAFDEYIMVEFMAPVGLAKQDYKYGYQNERGYSQPGIRVSHVDARVYNSNHNTPCQDDPQNGSDFRVCNTKGGRMGVGTDSDYWERKKGDASSRFYYTLTSMFESVIDESNNWTKSKTYLASNESLFTKNHTFSLEEDYGYAEIFMPSGTNLWNKAKTVTGYKGTGANKTQNYTIDETMTCEYELTVLAIEKDEVDEYVAYVRVNKIAD